MTEFSTYYNEIDANCLSVLEKHISDGWINPGYIDRRSIVDVGVDDVRNYREAHFFAGIGGFALGFARAAAQTNAVVWSGGFPCQDLSLAGRRKGLVGERSGLYFEFHRLIAGVLPDYVVIENVPGLLSSNQGRDFAVVLAGLTGVVCDVPEDGWGNAGIARGKVYHVAWRLLDSQFFGVAQRRRRLYLVANLRAAGGRCAQILFESEGGAGHPQARAETGKDVAAAVVSRAHKGGFTDPLNDNILAVGGDGLTSSQAHGGTVEIPESDDAERTAYNVLGLSGNAKTRHAYPTETARTIDTWTGTEDKNAASTLIVEKSRPEATTFDVRNLQDNGEVTGTIQAKNTGGYSLNYQDVVVEGEKPQITGTLGAEGGRNRNLDNANETDLLVVQDEMVAMDMQQATSNVNRSVPHPESPPLTPESRTIVFAQNQRNELRDLEDRAGVLAAEPGTRQQNFIAFDRTQPEWSEDQTGTLRVSRGATEGVNDANPDFWCSTTPAGVRRLTPTECERLQGFPSSLKWEIEIMTRDEFAAALLATELVIVNSAEGKIYHTRGQRGTKLPQPKETVGSNVNGYLVGSFKLAGQQKQIRFNRLVWISENGIIPDGHVIHHRNNIKTDNRIENLELVTAAENSHRASEEGLYRSGEDNPSTKISHATARQIADDYQQGDTTIRKLAQKYGISKSRVHQIVHLQGWTEFNAEGKRQSDSVRYRQLGNAVTVNVTEWIFKRIAEVEHAKEAQK